MQAKHRTNRGWVVTAVAAMALAPAAATAGGPAITQYPYTVTCTTGMVTDIVRNIAGEKANVSGIIGEGVDPHLYQPTRSNIGKLRRADVIFYSGLKLEGKMSDTLENIGRKRPVYAVTHVLEEQNESELLAPPEFAGHYDPHVWMDVSLWKQCAEMVAKTLGSEKIDPSNAEYYMRNYEAYAKKLDELDAYARAALATIPENGRVMVTAHDAFNYFGRAYGLEVRGIQGISTESEAGIDDINRLVDLLVARNVQAVFVETSVAQKNVQALIEGAKSRGKTVHVGGSLFSDAMGKPGSYEGTYVGMIDHNVTTIARALGGDAPAGGFQGKLATE